MINITVKLDCCGCAACVQRCPKQCIALIEDEEGFLYPQVNKELCIGCGLCEKVCPLLNQDEPIPVLKTLAVKNRSEDIRMASSSGGVFFALAKMIIECGGVVFGVVYDENWEAKHTYAETLDGVKAMMGSKYMQSRTENTFREAEQFLKQGREVMFTGTPCQIAGLRKFLRKDYANLLAVDFLCHGVPSPGVWRRYLKETLMKLPFKVVVDQNDVSSQLLNRISLIDNIEFRNKAKYGWEKYSVIIRGKLASTEPSSILLSDLHDVNPYMKGFLSDIYLRPSCYSCRCKNGINHSDITIADYWGIKILFPDFYDDKGIGLVLLNTIKGKDIFECLDMVIKESSLKDAMRFNGGFDENRAEHSKRNIFFEQLSTGCRVEDIIETCLYMPLYLKLYKKMRSLLKRIKCKIFNILLHKNK